MFIKRLILSALAATFLGISGLSLSAMNNVGATPTTAATSQRDTLLDALLLGQDRDRSSSKNERLSFLIRQQKLLESVSKGENGEDAETKALAATKLRDVQAQYRALLFGGSNTGALIARGLATGDKNSFTRALDDMTIDSWYDGIGKGMLLQIANAGGNFVGEKTKGMFDKLGGGLVDTLTTQIRNAFYDFNAYFFHDGMKPFDKSKLEAWANMILDSLNNINAMVENGAGFGLRAMDMTSRQSEEDAAGQSTSTPDQAKILDAWTEFATIHAEEYRYFIEHMQKTKEYYEEGDVVIFYVDKICQMLAVMYKLLTETTSFKDFTNKLSSNKMMVKAMSSYLKNYFQYLYKEVCVRAGDDQGAKNAATIGGSGGYRGIGGGYDAGYNNGGFSGTPVF